MNAYANLRALAQAATPGEWIAKPHGRLIGGPIRHYTNGDAQSQIASCSVTFHDQAPDDEPERQEANTAYIAAVSPVHILALLDELDQLRAAAPVKKTRAKKAAPAAAGAVVLPDWMPVEEWAAFLDMRKKIKKPPTDYAQTLLIKKLAAFYANDLDPGVILNQSIMNGWQDLYAPKEASIGQRYDRGQRTPVADQNRANNAEAHRLLGQPMFSDDGMTIEAMP